MRAILNERGLVMGSAVDVPAIEVPAVEKNPATPENAGAANKPQGIWRRRARPVLFWTHLVAGLISGIVVLIMSATGVALTYQKQMTSWADLRGLDGASPTATAPRLPVDSLLSRVARDSALTPTSITWRAGDAQPVEMVFPQGRRLFVNAYTAQVLGSGSASMRKFFRTMTDWHRWLAMSGERRGIGRAVTGVSNLAFLVLVLTGIWLWWPRNLSRVAFRNVVTFRRGLSSKARDFNWHHVIGFWSFVPLAVVVASGAVISYGWAGNLVYRLAGEAPPSRQAAPAQTRSATDLREPQAPAERVPAATARIPLDSAARIATIVAAQRVPDWRVLTLTVPKADANEFAFNIDRGMGGEPQKRTQLVLSADGSESRWQGFADQTRGRRWRSILRFAHTGEVLGVAGQTLAGLVSLGGALLVYTGLALSWRRWRAWQKRRAGVSLNASLS